METNKKRVTNIHHCLYNVFKLCLVRDALKTIYIQLKILTFKKIFTQCPICQFHFLKSFWVYRFAQKKKCKLWKNAFHKILFKSSKSRSLLIDLHTEENF